MVDVAVPGVASVGNLDVKLRAQLELMRQAQANARQAAELRLRSRLATQEAILEGQRIGLSEDRNRALIARSEVETQAALEALTEARRTRREATEFQALVDEQTRANLEGRVGERVEFNEAREALGAVGAPIPPQFAAAEPQAITTDERIAAQLDAIRRVGAGDFRFFDESVAAKSAIQGIVAGEAEIGESAARTDELLARALERRVAALAGAGNSSRAAETLRSFAEVSGFPTDDAEVLASFLETLPADEATAMLRGFISDIRQGGTTFNRELERFLETVQARRRPAEAGAVARGKETGGIQATISRRKEVEGAGFTSETFDGLVSENPTEAERTLLRHLRDRPEDLQALSEDQTLTDHILKELRVKLEESVAVMRKGGVSGGREAGGGLSPGTVMNIISKDPEINALVEIARTLKLDFSEVFDITGTQDALRRMTP